MKLPTIPPIDHEAAKAAANRQAILTKPLGALGYLEELSTKLAGITANPRPKFTKKGVIVMAADHGITRSGVSAYPSEVTLNGFNILNGGAAVSVARQRQSNRR